MTKMSSMPDDYDELIKKYCLAYMPGSDWRLLKAQFWVESNLNPVAISPAGAVGIAQFMPDTWEQATHALQWTHLDRTKPEASIEAGAWYMGYLLRQWYMRRPEVDRYCLALSCYNAGIGHILRCQNLSDGKASYAEIIRHLPAVTGHHSRETLDYVPRIYHAYMEIVTEHAI